jgi:thymidylate kinase
MMSIHLHTEVAWEGIKFLDEEKLWNTIRHVEVDGVKIGFPSCENILLITAAHAFFENKSFSLYDLKCIIESIQKGHDLNWEYIADCTIKGGWFDPFYATLHLADYIHKSLFQKKLVKEEVFKELRKKRKSFRKISLETELVNLFNKEPVLPFKLPKSRIMMAFIRKVLAVSDFAFIKKTEKIFSVSRSYLGRRLKREIPAFLICFSGQDGAGKTTHSKMLQYALKQRGVETIYIWTRGIGLSIEPFLSLGRFLLIGSKSLKSPKYILKRELLLKREPFKTLWAYITIIDALLLLFIKVKIPLLLGQSVICDRHILDTLVDVKCELGKDIHWVIEECAMKLAPRPNLHFILYFTPEEARRSDLNPEIVRCKGHEYLLRFHSRKLILIDTNSSLEQNSIKILTLFIKERYIGKN